MDAISLMPFPCMTLSGLQDVGSSRARGGVGEGDEENEAQLVGRKGE